MIDVVVSVQGSAFCESYTHSELDQYKQEYVF